MRKIWITAVLAILAVSLFANKTILQKYDSHNKIKKHPYTHMLAENRSFASRTDVKDSRYNKLLVILVDFQEELNPLTTGNGKFLLQADPDWKTTIGAPPHDRTYFETNLEALRYYYKAVSNESYDLEYDVFPKDKAAYTLPHPMGYYNPPNANSQLFLQRMEEYFKVSFETADSDDPQIDFSQYGHFMIIHAGSDWQHDVVGDTPSDIPSFFIRVGSGKEAIVDGGAVSISNACNVPSMISQDFNVQTENEQAYHSGYGALNAVIAHEFGHSLGLVDLYNVYNFQPMVGAFDIMDSGGGGILIDQASDGSYVLVEGVLPALPGAFSRALLFESYYYQEGFMQDIVQIEQFNDITIRASSSRQNPLSPKLSIAKIPLNSSEYLLIENRSVDPDNDGGTAVFGALNNRVILYPTAFEDDNDSPTYEYDYLLPSFISPDGASIGGGILVWHVDEQILYGDSNTNDNGVFLDNFSNNSVNTNYNRRAVKIIEADALPDLGYIYSYYWTGTPYEYYHKNKPILDSNGFFVNWSQSVWNDRLNSTSKPPLLDNSGNPCFNGMQIMSNPSALMNVRFTSAFFDQAQKIYSISSFNYALPVISSSFTNQPELPIIVPQYDGTMNVKLYTLDPNPNQADWINLTGDFHIETLAGSNPITSDFNGNGITELIQYIDNRIRVHEFVNDQLETSNTTFDTPITTAPMFFDGYLWVATQNRLYRLRDDTIEFEVIEGISNIAGAGNLIHAIRNDAIYSFHTTSFSLMETTPIPVPIHRYEPIIFHDTSTSSQLIYLMSDSGDIYLRHNGLISTIFKNPHPLSLPTQMAMFSSQDNSPLLTFALGNKVYCLRWDGSFMPGYPETYLGNTFDAYGHARVLQMDNDQIILFHTNQKGYFGVSHFNGYMPQYTLFWNKRSIPDYLYWNQDVQKIYWIVSEDGPVSVFGISGLSENPILWNGFRNQGTSCFYGVLENGAFPGTPIFDAFVFPNPVNSDQMRIRLIDPRGDTKINIFDISGNKIYASTFSDISLPTRDIQIDSSKLSSGFYIAIVENFGQTKKLKFTIEK